MYELVYPTLSYKIALTRRSTAAKYEISVIVTVDSANVMDAYNGSDKTMSLSEFAAKGEGFEELKNDILNEKSEVLKNLNKNLPKIFGGV